MNPLSLAVLALATSAPALDITTPDQTVLRGDPGVLGADLVCSPPRVGIHLENGAALHLNGHVLDGCTVAAASPSQTAPQRITVYGPGTIRNAGISLRAGRLRVRDVVIENAPTWAIIGSGDSADGPSSVAAVDVTVTGSGFAGIQATKVIARGVTSTGNGTVGPPGQGIIAWAGLKGRNVTVTDNAAEGIFVSWGPLRVRGAVVTGNAGSGVVGDPSIKISHSTVTGNNTGGDPFAADVVSQVLPKLKNSTCGTSLDAQLQQPWGICTDD
jgi:hypothetical protein